MKTIVCPVDYSANAAGAVRYALALNKHLKARILLLHAYETPMFSDPGFLSDIYTDSAIHQAERKRLEAFKKRVVGPRSGQPIELVLVQGLASSRICDIARARG